MTILQNWENLQNRLSILQKQPQVIAVSKTKPISLIREACESKILTFGENRIQEAIEKFTPLQKEGIPFELHHIGPVQSGTLKKLFGLFRYTHGVGSLSTLEELSKKSEKVSSKLGFFLQVNLTQENSKHGFSEDEIINLLPRVSQFETEYLEFSGLMTIGPTNGDKEWTRKVFQKLFQIREAYCPGKKISMGMSGDFEIALEEGTDIIRVGSLLFGNR
jgi:pyridoxal phosphate enzyme (YggS family)